ncbi:plasma kallikrein [Biomphalaria pfeifferi]|uniref:Plasma kallikrein n=1 Tax=Biomphalaria pfeifferi TaxID=112525 RepID=A0AAD8F1Q8_BIOPF|nr:plasma kallikrein [Biomphalaria pfeifferi]
MQNLVAVLGLVLICLVESALTGGKRCSSLATGVCVSRSQECPANYIEQAAYSNYIGCYTLDKICCTLKVSTDSTTTTTTPTTPSPTSQPQCGTSSSIVFDRILGGVPTAPCDWPFVVSIRSLLRDQTNIDLSTTGPACQGVLVDKRWVLTSAFCALAAGGSIEDTSYVDRMLVVAAEYNVSQVDIDPSTGQPQEQVIRVERIILHPDYRFRSQSEFYPFNDSVALNSNNVALIKLAEPINGKCSGVICLPTQSEANNSCQGYDDCVITGWGFSTELFEGTPMELLGARVKLSSRDACDFLAERLGLTTVRPVGSLCQSPVFQNTDSCLGDEGGAVMCFNGRSWTVRALLPFNLCTNNKYNLFVTDVHPYITWIQNTISSN